VIHVITWPIRWVLYHVPIVGLSSPRRTLGLSLPARAALLVFLLLVTCTVCAIVAVLLAKDAASVLNYFGRPGFYVVVGLILVIPVVVYYWLKLWLEGDVSRFPDIDDAWKEGMAALQANGLDITGIPLFLVLGVPDERLSHAVFKASAMEFLVEGIPHGRAPLRWYGNDQGIYLVCIDASRLSKLHGLGKAMTGGPQQPESIAQTLQPSGGSRDTLVTPASARDSAPAAADLSGEEATGSGELRGTLVPGATSGSVTPGNVPATPTSSALSRQEAEHQTERLQYVCELLRRARQPVCSLNGILVVLPLENMQNVMLAKDMPGVIKHDLAVVRDTTKLRCPVTAMVVGMERETGFCELVRRVGTSRAKAHRFGKGFDVWNPPTAESIDAFSSHACGAFEDWVYSLFRERDGLSKPGNARLYTLLCRIRSELRSRLRNILLYGFSFEPGEKQPHEKPLLFNGCYFAATGDTGDRQAFVKNVFEKMLDLEEELEWTPEALREDARYHRLAQFGMFVDGALILGLVGMLAYRFVWHS
jgi:hypothetical protein